MTNLNSGRWGARGSERAGARDMAMDTYDGGPGSGPQPGGGSVSKPTRTFTPEQIELSKKAVERAREAHNSAPVGIQKQARRKELENAEKWLKKVLASSAQDFAMDPLTNKGEEIKSAMEKEYGPKKGESVFYASANKGTIKGVHDKAEDDWSPEAREAAAKARKAAMVNARGPQRTPRPIDAKMARILKGIQSKEMGGETTGKTLQPRFGPSKDSGRWGGRARDGYDTRYRSKDEYNPPFQYDRGRRVI